MKIKLDENLSRHLKTQLQANGHDVTTTADEGLLGQPDTAVAAAARGEGRIVITLDVGFADLRKNPPGSHPGIVVFRLKDRGPLTINEAIAGFLVEIGPQDISGCLVVVDDQRIRIRRPSE